MAKNVVNTNSINYLCKDMCAYLLLCNVTGSGEAVPKGN